MSLDDPHAIRRAGRDLLSLALLDARNHLLHALAAWPEPPALALRLALDASRYQETWITRQIPQQPDGAGEAPDAQAVRGTLAQTLETTLDLLASTPDDDAALHFFRQALLHEDRLVEALAALLQRGAPPARQQRPPLWLPAQTWRLGSPAPADGGSAWTPHNERWAHAVHVPEFEIDAQPVNWQQFAEFAADGGYDRSELWTESPGARRAPRHVEQLAGGVLVRRGGAGVLRAAAGQAAMHVTRFEAEAWCRWAGRRLPTEPEWEIAASLAASRGLVWGDVFEWVAGSARAWPGAGPAEAGCLDRIPAPGTEPVQGVLRGSSFATLPRRRHVKARRFAAPTLDTAFTGFRSCSL
jgi:formylglycine-generating enzyme required for sulfatase activity